MSELLNLRSVFKEPSLTNQSVMNLSMYFNYENNQRNDVSSKTTFDAIRSGERTSTLRKIGSYATKTYKKLKNLKPGDIVTVWSGYNYTGRSQQVVITHEVEVFKGGTVISDERMEDISRTEGWSVDYLLDKGYDEIPADGEMLYIRYKPVDTQLDLFSEEQKESEGEQNKNECGPPQ